MGKRGLKGVAAGGRALARRERKDSPRDELLCGLLLCLPISDENRVLMLRRVYRLVVCVCMCSRMVCVCVYDCLPLLLSGEGLLYGERERERTRAGGCAAGRPAANHGWRRSRLPATGCPGIFPSGRPIPSTHVGERGPAGFVCRRKDAILERGTRKREGERERRARASRATAPQLSDALVWGSRHGSVPRLFYQLAYNKILKLRSLDTRVA